MIAVLNGSTSASCSANAVEYSDMPNRPRKMMYLIGQSRSCKPHGNRYCGIFTAWAMLLSSSCSAPNGHSQPQNGPRPQNRSPAAIDPHSRKISGADRKYSQLKPVSSELAKVRTLTTESWALAYQPSQTRMNSR